MGALFQNVCYPTQDAAREQACSSFDAKAIDNGNLHTAECVSSAGPQMELCKRIDGGICATISKPWPVTPPCDHVGGVSLSYDYFLGALVLLSLIWGIKKLIQLFNTHHAPE